MGGGKARALAVVPCHGVKRRVGKFASQQHAGNAVLRQQGEAVAVFLAGAEDNAVDLIADGRANGGGLGGGVFVGVQNQRLIALFLQKAAQRADALGENGVGHVAEDERDGVTLPGAHRTGEHVVHVAHFARRLVNPRLRRRLHQRRIAQREGHGVRRQAEPVGDAFQGGLVCFRHVRAPYRSALERKSRGGLPSFWRNTREK